MSASENMPDLDIPDDSETLGSSTEPCHGAESDSDHDSLTSSDGDCAYVTPASDLDGEGDSPNENSFDESHDIEDILYPTLQLGNHQVNIVCSGGIIALPEEYFKRISPIFLEKVEKSKHLKDGCRQLDFTDITHFHMSVFLEACLYPEFIPFPPNKEQYQSLLIHCCVAHIAEKYAVPSLCNRALASLTAMLSPKSPSAFFSFLKGQLSERHTFPSSELCAVIEYAKRLDAPWLLPLPTVIRILVLGDLDSPSYTSVGGVFVGVRDPTRSFLGTAVGRLVQATFLAWHHLFGLISLQNGCPSDEICIPIKSIKFVQESISATNKIRSPFIHWDEKDWEEMKGDGLCEKCLEMSKKIFEEERNKFYHNLPVLLGLTQEGEAGWEKLDTKARDRWGC